MPGSETSKFSRGASAPESSSSRSSSSRALGQCCGAGTGQWCQNGRPIASDAWLPHARPVVVAEIVRSGFVEGHHYGSWVALDRRRLGARRRRRRRAPDAPSLVQQADPGARDARGGPRARRASCWRWPARRTPVSRSTSRGYAASSPARGSPRTPCRPRRTTRSTTTSREELIRRGGVEGADPDELLGQARGDARHLCGQRLADRQLPRRRTTRCSRRSRPPSPGTTGEPVAHVAVDGCGAPLLSTSLIGLARAFARLATGTSGPALNDRRRDPARTPSASPAPAATS